MTSDPNESSAFLPLYKHASGNTMATQKYASTEKQLGCETSSRLGSLADTKTHILNILVSNTSRREE
jgi:hypothetical protein